MKAISFVNTTLKKFVSPRDIKKRFVRGSVGLLHKTSTSKIYKTKKVVTQHMLDKNAYEYILVTGDNESASKP